MTLTGDLPQPWVLNEGQALPVMKAAWDVGINTFDTANMYSNGESETIIRNFISKVCYALIRRRTAGPL